MKVSLITSAYINRTNTKHHGNNPKSSILDNPTMNDYRPHFYGLLLQKKMAKGVSKDAYSAAKEYLKSLRRPDSCDMTCLGLSNVDLEKLNGIQRGIDVFNGLSMKDIRYIVNNLSAVMVKRGCSSRCSHCATSAVPQNFSKHSDMISSMSWEDFTSFFEGADKLSDRLGFNVFKENNRRYITLFHDADCVELEMRDKAGKVYDFVDANILVGCYTNRKGLFDTSGWNPKSERLQQRAEKIVKYLSNNTDKMDQINISLNPFHALLEKSNECRKSGKFLEAKKFRKFYVDRMANAIFTFTPLMKKYEFNFMQRVKSGDKLHDNKALGLIKREILMRLEQMYRDDYKLNKFPKYVKKESQIEEFMKMARLKMQKDSSEIGNLGRAEQFFKKPGDENYYGHLTDKGYFLTSLRTRDLEVYIDANGKVYSTNEYLFSPQNMQLNFSNRNKKTILPTKFITIDDLEKSVDKMVKAMEAIDVGVN